MSESDETFPITLAGRTWGIPHLPFRVIKKLQPRMMGLQHALLNNGDFAGAALLLDEKSLDELAAATHQAIAHVEPQLTLDAFLDLPLSLAGLIAALPSLMQACGLQVVKASAAAAGDQAEKK